MKLALRVRMLIVATSLVAGAALVVMRCGGDIAETPSAPCSAGLRPEGAAYCASYELDLTGDLATCGFDDAGQGSDEACHRMCRWTVSPSGACWFTRWADGANRVWCSDSCEVDAFGGE